MHQPMVEGKVMAEKRECEDLLNMFEYIDKADCGVPTFVAADLNKVSNLKASDADDKSC